MKRRGTILFEAVLAISVLAVCSLAMMQTRMMLIKAQHKLEVERQQLKSLQEQVQLAQTEPIQRLLTDSRFIIEEIAGHYEIGIRSNQVIPGLHVLRTN